MMAEAFPRLSVRGASLCDDNDGYFLFKNLLIIRLRVIDYVKKSIIDFIRE